MSSPPEESTSPGLFNNRCCQVNLPEESSFGSKGVANGATLDGKNKSLGIQTRNKKSNVSDANKCLYCSRCFVGQKGLNIHLHSCKNKALLDGENLRVVLDDVTENQEYQDQELESVPLHCSPQTEGSKSELLANQENLHSVMPQRRIDIDFKTLSCMPQKSKILWPKMNDDDKWKMFEQLVEANIPDPWLPVAKRIDILENAIYEQGIFLF